MEYEETLKIMTFWAWTICVIIIFLSMVIIFSDAVLAWSPSEFCNREANGSISEYLTCVDYFNNLTGYRVIYNVNTTIVNNTIYDNKTTIVYIPEDNEVNLNDYVKTIDVYNKHDIDLMLENLDLRTINQFKDELKKGGWLDVKEVYNYTYTPDLSSLDVVKKAEMEDYVKKSLDSSKNNETNVVKEDYTVFYVIIALIIGLIVYYFSNKKKHNYDNHYSIPVVNSAPSGIEENQRLMKLMNDQSHAIEKLMAENKLLNDSIDKVVKTVNEQK